MTAPHSYTDTGHDETDRARLLAFARAMQTAGLHLMPPRQGGSKWPVGDPITKKWKQFQARPLTEGEFQAFFVKTKRTGLGVFTGTPKTVIIEGHSVEVYHTVLDFDTHDIYTAWREAALASGYGALVQRIEGGWRDDSPNGTHLHFWCYVLVQSKKLARSRKENQDIKTLIEIKARGGYIITAPTFGDVHPEGKPYIRVSGGPHAMAVVTADESENLFRIAKGFDQILPGETHEEHHERTRSDTDQEQYGDARPGDLFAARTGWRDILEPHGWAFLFTSRDGVSFWRRPGKDRGVSATSGYAGTDYFYPFTTSSIFEANRAYSKFSAYTVLNHSGDFSSAAAELAARGFTTNGHSSDGGASDEEENAHYTEQEREPDPESDSDPEETANEGHASQEQASTSSDSNSDRQAAGGTATGKAEGETDESYPIPDSLRIGIFARVAEALGRWDWETWHGVFVALCARSHRNLHCYYYSAHVYGNNYSLLINTTASGKEYVVNVARTLLGKGYKIRTSLNSGPALVPMLTDDPLNAKGGHLAVNGVPVLLLCSEWSRVAQMAGIENATLIEDLNALHMIHYEWTQSRSHKSSSGGDVVIQKPTLTVGGTTTRKLFYSAVTEKALDSGAVNRYLIVPGSAKFQKYTGTSYKTEGRLEGLIDDLTNHTMGHGAEVATFYTPEAWEAFDEFQDKVIIPLMNDDESAALRRLHVHLQHAAALYAWQEKSPKIELRHFQAAKDLAEISKKFVEELLAERAQEYQPTQVQAVEAAMERTVIERLKASPRQTRRDLARRVSHGKGSYWQWAKVIDGLIKAGVLVSTDTKDPRRWHVHEGV